MEITSFAGTQMEQETGTDMEEQNIINAMFYIPKHR